MGHLPETTFLSFGKPKKMWQPILQTYEDRLAKTGGFRHVILREKGQTAEQVTANAAALLEPHLREGIAVLVFDERGKTFPSIKFTQLLASVP